MAPESPPLVSYKFAQSTTDYTVGYYGTSTATSVSSPVVVFVGGARERTYESELRAAAAGPGLEKLRKILGWLRYWAARRKAEVERAERYRACPPARPPKARTEWGMVHRERCVHRCGLN